MSHHKRIPQLYVFMKGSTVHFGEKKDHNSFASVAYNEIQSTWLRNAIKRAEEPHIHIEAERILVETRGDRVTIMIIHHRSFLTSVDASANEGAIGQDFC